MEDFYNFKIIPWPLGILGEFIDYECIAFG